MHRICRCTTWKTNYPIEQILAAAIPDMDLHLLVEVTHLPIPTSLTSTHSIVVAGVHTTGVGPHLLVQCLRTEPKLIPSMGVVGVTRRP